MDSWRAMCSGCSRARSGQPWPSWIRSRPAQVDPWLRPVLAEVAETVIADVPDDIEVPEQLIGTQTKRLLLIAARALGKSPVTMLRIAVIAGLTGSKPLLESM